MVEGPEARVVRPPWDASPPKRGPPRAVRSPTLLGNGSCEGGCLNILYALPLPGACPQYSTERPDSGASSSAGAAHPWTNAMRGQEHAPKTAKRGADGATSTHTAAKPAKAKTGFLEGLLYSSGPASGSSSMTYDEMMRACPPPPPRHEAPDHEWYTARRSSSDTEDDVNAKLATVDDYNMAADEGESESQEAHEAARQFMLREDISNLTAQIEALEAAKMQAASQKRKKKGTKKLSVGGEMAPSTPTKSPRKSLSKRGVLCEVTNAVLGDATYAASSPVVERFPPGSPECASLLHPDEVWLSVFEANELSDLHAEV
ncbi:hypothetical protein M885DRAFT_508430 [Pelagophyceae sp. CCMP2097]|nr:hypothetical protein M885DRAFT_508430 [Pelagophyceae sp. CCMP2097]